MRRPEQMCTGVLGETESVERASALLVAEHSFSSVAKGQNTQSGATDGRLGGLFIHLRIGEIRCYLVVHP